MSKKNFLQLCLAALLALLMCSCSPSAYVLSLESRAPSESGLSLAGKSLAVVYLESENGADSLYNNRAADALAYALEDEYFDGEEAVNVYNLVKDPAGVYSSKDTLSQYIMLLDCDVVMILDTPALTVQDSDSSIPVNSRLYIYDSMAKDEEVITLDARSVVSSISDAARSSRIGESLAKPLKNQWQNEDFTLVYFDEYKWIEALELADSMKWPEAIEKWMELSKSNNASKASSAKYNVAVGCYVLGQYDLALEWLESSDKSYPLSLNQPLRTKIQKKNK